MAAEAAWEAVIGLETHVQLGTHSKIFTAASTAFGDDPNTHIDPVVCGLPGTLPVLNQKVLEYAVKAALALNLNIAEHSKFDRKQYFYPDLPKNYQISQYDEPIAEDGWIDVEVAEKGKDTYLKRIGIERLHMEEDAGKLVHAGSDRLAGSTHSLVDYNRAGVALAEIVSKPDLRTGREAAEYASEIRRIMRYLGVSDGNMQEGSLRCDVNISVRHMGKHEYGTRCEIKNLNSFRFVEKAILHEAQRQIDIIEDGGRIIQETRLYDADRDETRSMRSKEVANDYRYFPEPDLLPIVIDEAYIESVRAELPELSIAKRARFVSQYGLSDYDAGVLSSSREMADYFEEVVKICGDAKLSANWVSGDLQALLNKSDLEIDQSPVSTQRLGALIGRIKDQTISSKIAKTVFEALLGNTHTVDEIIESQGLKQVTDTGAIEKLVDEVIAANPEQVAQFRAGKDKVFAFFIGQAMKASKGKANPEQLNALLLQKLKA